MRKQGRPFKRSLRKLFGSGLEKWNVFLILLSRAFPQFEFLLFDVTSAFFEGETLQQMLSEPPLIWRTRKTFYLSIGLQGKK
jgi:hypothetical protein